MLVVVVAGSAMVVVVTDDVGALGAVVELAVVDVVVASTADPEQAARTNANTNTLRIRVRLRRGRSYEDSCDAAASSHTNVTSPAASRSSWMG